MQRPLLHPADAWAVEAMWAKETVRAALHFDRGSHRVTGVRVEAVVAVLVCFASEDVDARVVCV